MYEVYYVCILHTREFDAHFIFYWHPYTNVAQRNKR